MKLKDITSFRKDLLFHGAVQLGWFERKKELADKAASNFIFHGPSYHGVQSRKTADDTSFEHIDTASFTKEIIARATGNISDDPFIIAIAGYGTGKSHLAVTLATMLSDPGSEATAAAIKNLISADKEIGSHVRQELSSLTNKPFLFVTLNGMEDFDLAGEVSRQIVRELKRRGLETARLDNLKPRFQQAAKFIANFNSILAEDLAKHFGTNVSVEEIQESLESQNEGAFQKVNEIYHEKMESAIPAVGQESLQDFIRATEEIYCGEGNPFAGIIIFFDEFGRYLEFAVQKPHIAGPASIQQLYEAVQESSEQVFWVSFIQNELKAYASRVAPERREEIQRYLARFDSVKKVRLSTNLETVIANLLEKKKPDVVRQSMDNAPIAFGEVKNLLLEWFPEAKNHSLWSNYDSFYKIVCEGCWPLNPLSTWVMYSLASFGKTLQERSMLSLLGDVFDIYGNAELETGQSIYPAQLLTPSLIAEFLASESSTSQGAITYSYQLVVEKYANELSAEEKSLLKSVVLQSKLRIKLNSKEDCIRAVAMFGGIEASHAEAAMASLEKNLGVLEWNAVLSQYEIIGDAVSRKTFLHTVTARAEGIGSQERLDLFYANGRFLLGKDELATDFGADNNIFTKEWNYNIKFSNVLRLETSIALSLGEIEQAHNVDENKGQLLYCYVGLESSLEVVQMRAIDQLKALVEKKGFDWETGVPLAVIFLHDSDGVLGQNLAEYHVLENFTDVERQKFGNFIADKKRGLEQEFRMNFVSLEKDRCIVYATEREDKIKPSRTKKMLEDLFAIVYDKRIPFPFDGFSTSRGNAAKDCVEFTKLLFLGKLDRNLLQASSPQQKNRGYAVFDEYWGIFDKDDSVNIRPKHPGVRAALDIVDSLLAGKDGVVNLGQIADAWLNPPYGFNIAIVGLLLGLYIGRRKDDLELVCEGERNTYQQWFDKAFSNKFASLDVLGATDLQKMSEEQVSEWDRLLDEWDLEETHSGKKKLCEQAEKLKRRIPLPSNLFYKYHLCIKATEQADNEFTRVWSKVEMAKRMAEDEETKQDVLKMAKLAAELAAEYASFTKAKNKWHSDEIKEFEQNYSIIRMTISKVFTDWLIQQQANDHVELAKLNDRLLRDVGKNLERIGLLEEKEELESHMQKVEHKVNLISEAKEIIGRVERLVAHGLSERPTMHELQAKLDTVNDIRKELDTVAEAESYKDKIDEGKRKLRDFESLCKKQIEAHKKKAAEIFDHRPVASRADIGAWRGGAMVLLGIFVGQEKDIEDFNLIEKQLGMLEQHYDRLNNTSVSDQELEKLLLKCREEVNKMFANDSPPLDADLLYSDIMKTVRKNRKRHANEWLEEIKSRLKSINKASAQELVETLSRLESMPAVLSDSQREKINASIKECKDKLDELEVEGLLARFDAISADAQKDFLTQLSKMVEKKFPGSVIKLKNVGV